MTNVGAVLSTVKVALVAPPAAFPAASTAVRPQS
jgi:hypothetical protein